MKLWDVLSIGCILLAVSHYLCGQEGGEKDVLEQSLSSCNIIWDNEHEMNLACAGERVCVSDDDVAAGKACGDLVGAIATSDAANLERAVKKLRPMLALSELLPTTPQEQLEAMEKKAQGASETELFYELPTLGQRAFNAGKIENAENYANQLLRMAPERRADPGYGEAVFYGNFVLGRIAVKRGDFAKAGEYLLLAGSTPGSPALDSFGPNMTLARELVENGKSDVVLRYLALCKTYWKMDEGKLEEWSALIEGGEKPDFSGYDYQ